MLRVVIVSAHVSPEVADLPDTCVVATFRDMERRTRVIQKDQHPHWNETLVWYLDLRPLDSTSSVIVQILDWSTRGQSNFGFTKVSLTAVVERPRAIITLKDQELHKSNMQKTGNTITLRIAFTPPVPQTFLQPPKPGFQDFRKLVCCGGHAKPSSYEELVPKEKGGGDVSGGSMLPAASKRDLGNRKQAFQTFVQNFHEIPNQLFEECVTIQVLNSRAMRAASVIGVVKIEIGTIYEYPGHALISKWLSLYNPDNLNAGLKGYVKVNLCVLGAGDRAPDTDAVKENVRFDDNLLKSAETPEVHMATLKLYIYEAEDMPQMDYFYARYRHDSGDYVDPSLEVKFAGNVPPPTQDPPPVIPYGLFPRPEYEMSEILGTTFLNLSQISSTGMEGKDNLEGFLPCFGPSFLSLYKRPAELISYMGSFSNPDTEFEEGVNYRGRVLVEVTTSREEIPAPQIDSIPEERVAKAERFLSRHRYGLCAVFYSATMLANIKELIQFEVSIGNYGNKSDVTCKPYSSTTQYCHAVYDGNHYYYLPWYDTKPMVAISSLWEDVSYRIACMNTMEFMHSRLAGLGRAGKLASEALTSLQRGLSELCLLVHRMPFPALGGPEAPATVLDEQLRKRRLRLLQQISKAADKTTAKTPLKKLIAKGEKWLQRIASVIPETQISIPDVIIWMLCDEKRVAHARVKVHTIMFSNAGPYAKGRLCGKTQNIFLKGVESKAKYTAIPALLRVRMWLGKLTDSAELMKYCEGTILVYAEMHNISLLLSRLLLDTETNHTEVLEEVFENQTRKPGLDWESAPIPYSNVNGDPVLAIEEMVCPPGWFFVEAWHVEVNRAVDDAGKSPFLPRGSIECDSWLGVLSVAVDPELMPVLWLFPTISPFLQHSKKKSEEGDVWEYAPLYGWKFHLQQRSNDVFRRRCWHRKLTPSGTDHLVAPIFLLEGSLGVELEQEQLKKMGEAAKKHDEKDEKDEEEGNVQINDLARISSYLLKMNTPLVFCLFKDPVYYQLRCYIFQARDLVGSPARSSADPLAQVSFVHMSQCTQIHYGTLHPCWDQTLVFDNILIYGNPQATEQDPPTVAVEIFDYDTAVRVGHSEFFMGRSLCSPSVCLDLNSRKMPHLSKYPITREKKESGLLLAAFELLLDKKDGSLGKHPTPAWKDGSFTIPKGIRPVLTLMAIEILAWGLRNMKNYNLLVIYSPSLIIECGGESIETPPIQNLQENPNFSINTFLMKVILKFNSSFMPNFEYISDLLASLHLSIGQYLPEDADYSPPIELKVIDHREFGYKPVVGQATVRNLSQYTCDPWEASKSHNLPVRALSKIKLKAGLRKFTYKPWSLWKAKEKEGAKEGEEEEEEEVDWWSKYYVTMGDLSKSGNYLQRGFDSVKIYNCELEAVPEFNGFQDFCQTFRLYRGQVKDESLEDPMVGGEFKGLFRIYPLPEDPHDPPPPRQFQELPESVSQLCVVRIYIIRAFQLQPKDRNGLCDPYIKIKIGKKRMGEREDYIPNTLEPTFGRMYELTCSIPVEKDLKISFYDFDVFPPDDLIGDTIIDLEDRLLSYYGANCGLPQTYCTSGPSQWRDQIPPTEILKNYVQIKNLPQPEISEDGKQAVFIGKIYHLSDFEVKVPSHSFLGPPKERMALHLLHKCGLVPEHIETRTLYSTTHPGIEQGKVQMWVDVFPECLGEPGPPFDITPRKPQRFELRCIIWNTKDVDLEDVNVFGDRMSDIYVKGWMDGMEEEKQRTDVHYRSLAGEGNFNWRFVFGMEYLPMEQGKVEMTLELLTEKEAEERPAGKGREEPNMNPVLKPPQLGVPEVSGSIPASIANQGSSYPPVLRRPETTFLWYMAPLKSLYYMVWQRNKWKLFGLLCVVLLFLLIAAFLYAAPEVGGREEAAADPLPDGRGRILCAVSPTYLQFTGCRCAQPPVLSSQGYLAMKLVNPMKTVQPLASKAEAAKD
ncbi:hypothetical protein lerEdw1_010008 [Lerista edwardsae]|nr:hypothetical protein lerEdw1_010008 [Lerista edwardsae]